MNLEPMIIVAYDTSGSFDDVRQSIHEGILQVESHLRDKHPDATEAELLHTLWQMMISNWAITAIAANALGENNEERLSVL